MDSQLSFNLVSEPRFAGDTYDANYDSARLSGQMLAVYNLMRDGCWRTLSEINAVVNGSEAGISARLRDCRKNKWGGNIVNRRRRGKEKSGCHEYQLIIRV